MSLALRILQADDEHVLREPTFRARLVAGDAQRMTLLTKESIATVAGAEALDGELFREVHDEAAFGIELSDRVQTSNEVAVVRDALQSRTPDPRHDGHVEHDIGAVSDFDTAAGQR